jgi:hypothetical protein
MCNRESSKSSIVEVRFSHPGSTVRMLLDRRRQRPINRAPSNCSVYVKALCAA